jgi:hypothetical protein
VLKALRDILVSIAALAAAACATESAGDEQRVDLRQPMRFGTSTAQAAEEVTRAQLETAGYTNFRVGTWKAFGTGAQQNVMDGYEVDYTPTAITDDIYRYNWYYENITPAGKSSAQILRYWDLAAFPYEFRAVAPYSTTATITPDDLSIDATGTPFVSEKHINYKNHVSALDANVTTVNEPYVVANVKREKSGTDYVDTDVIKNTEINSTGKANATREVHMPFHHLMSKIGFRIFIDNPQPTHSDYEVHIKDIIISVVDAQNFVIASEKYTATNAQGLGKGSFDPIYPTGTQLTTQSITYNYANEYILLEHEEPYPYKETIEGVEKNIDFHNHLNKEAAFDLTPGELLMIPQSGVKLRVQLHMQTHHVTDTTTDFTFDSILRSETLRETDIPYDEHDDLWTWEPEKKYIYYLHIRNLHGHEIVLHTCEVLPWEEVQTADIDVGL